MDNDFTSFVDALPGYVWTALPDGQLDFLNRAGREYTGLSSQEASGSGWLSAVHPQDLPELQARWQDMLTSGEPTAIQVRMRRQDGVYRWFLISSSPERDAAGHIIRWSGLNTDIEDKKRAEDALRPRAHPPRESTTRPLPEGDYDLNAIIDAIPMIAWATDADGFCDFYNQRWLEYAGVTLEEVQGWKWAGVIHPDDLAGLTEHWLASLASGKPDTHEARMRRHDGEYRWFLFLANPLRDSSGNIVKWFGTNVDIEDRKRAEEALISSERNLLKIINTLPTTAWSTRPDGYCDFLSDRWLDYAGYTKEQAIGWNWGAVIHPEDSQGLIDYWTGCLNSGVAVDTEARMRRYDGVYRWFLFRANPLRDESGTIVKWYGSNVDIEDRKQADEALRRSERSLSLIINTMPMFAWTTRPDGFCEYLNQPWLDYTGLTADEARGWGWQAALHPDDTQEVLAHWGASLESGEPLNYEARLRRFDGVSRWFLFRANPLRDESGSIVRWYGTNVDLEDRRRAEDELRRNEVLLAEGQRLSQTGSFYWHADTDTIRCSEELYRILAIDPDSVVTFARLARRVHAEDLPALTDKVAQARRTGTDIDYELRARMPDASFKYLRVTAKGTQGRDGKLEYVGAVQDLTERKYSDQALAEVRSELAYMTRVASMGALTASIAHEVNQPLSGILMNASACLRMLAADPPNVAGALETVRRTVRDGNRATDVITRLRALFARKDAASEPLDLNEATREVIALSLNELQRNRITVRTEMFDDLPAISGDRIQLQQVILNLIMNASAAMSGIDDRPRQLLIKTEQDSAETVRLSVQDVGVGIAPEDEDRLFQAFYTTKSSGLGIGLSVSRSIIESHAGRLWAEANTGPGATFSFSIPRALGAAIRRGSQLTRAPAASST